MVVGNTFASPVNQTPLDTARTWWCTARPGTSPPGPSPGTHHDLGDEERARRGIAGGMVRLSIGLQDPEDLIADLDQALPP